MLAGGGSLALRAAPSSRGAAPETTSAFLTTPAASISPEPVGGYRALRDYLHHNTTFEPEPPASGISGSVRLRFTVTAAGKLENFQVVRGMRPDYDAEAVRLICEGPAWRPGTANGRRADRVVELSVPF
jgi:TonB family protein